MDIFAGIFTSLPNRVCLEHWKGLFSSASMERENVRAMEATIMEHEAFQGSPQGLQNWKSIRKWAWQIFLATASLCCEREAAAKGMLTLAVDPLQHNFPASLAKKDLTPAGTSGKTDIPKL